MPDSTNIISGTVIGAAADNIADWNGDNRTRLADARGELISLQTVIGAILATVDATIADCDRVAGQVADIRAELATNTG